MYELYDYGSHEIITAFIFLERPLLPPLVQVIRNAETASRSGEYSVSEIQQLRYGRCVLEV